MFQMCVFFFRYYEQQINPGGVFLLYHNTQYKIEVSRRLLYYLQEDFNEYCCDVYSLDTYLMIIHHSVKLQLL